MKQLRIWFILFFGWLFALYNIERLHAPINLASFVYVLVPLCCLPIILVRWFHRRTAVLLIAAVVPIVLVLKLLFGYQIAGEHLPLTVTELCALALTILLAQRIGRSLEEFYQAVATTTKASLDDRSMPFESGQAEIYREVRRARQFQRPLAMLTISAKEESMQGSLDRLIEEVQETTVRQYAMAKLAELLSSKMKDSDIITYRNSHFVAVLPETERGGAEAVAERLETAAREELGLELSIGACTFPDEEVTFVNLLSNAESQLVDPASNGNGTNGKAAAHKSSRSTAKESKPADVELSPSLTAQRTA